MSEEDDVPGGGEGQTEFWVPHPALRADPPRKGEGCHQQFASNFYSSPCTFGIGWVA